MTDKPIFPDPRMLKMGQLQNVVRRAKDTAYEAREVATRLGDVVEAEYWAQILEAVALWLDRADAEIMRLAFEIE